MLVKQESINKESNSLKNKEIYDLTRFTQLDYPNELACIVWFNGCNMRCQYCYNEKIVFDKEGNYTYDEVLAFLRTRIGLLDAVVLSGGEACGKELITFCEEIKKLGFLIKLDTNGTYFTKVEELVTNELLDYIALDYKAPRYKFHEVTQSNKYEEFEKTLNYLLQKDVKFEVRTTVHSDLLDYEDINFMINDLHEKGYRNSYYLQKFLDTTSNIGDIHQEITQLREKDIRKDLLDIVFR